MFSNNNPPSNREVIHVCSPFNLTDAQINEVQVRFLNEIERGLAKKTHDFADVKCFITFVQDLPNGNEEGKFLALDLGGTNFRVLLITMQGTKKFQMESRIYAIPEDVMLGTGEHLFDHIAECLSNFMKDHNVYDEHLPLGFTFSFPLLQLGLTQGKLVRWTKGFNCSGVENMDVVQLLKQAIDRRGDVEISVMAILNDSTGTLMSCAHKNPNCRIGVIIGTGCNACYVEKVENVELFDGPKYKTHMLINTEWGAFGDSGTLEFIRTEFDRSIDKNSINPGKQIHEKLISGMYMGEIVRLIIVKLMQGGCIFNGISSDRIMTRYNFETKYVSEIEGEPNGTYAKCREILRKFGIFNPSDDDCRNIRYICECVSRRAAYLVAIALSTILNKMNEPKVTIGVDGSVYRFHPFFKHHLEFKMKQLAKSNIQFNLMLSDDGSGRGAALVAAVASRQN